MATIRVGMLLMSAIMGMNSISQSKRVVSIASVAGSIKGARLARKLGKKNHAQTATTILLTNSIIKKILATRVKVRAVFVLIFYDSPFRDSKALVLPEFAYCFVAKKLHNLSLLGVDDGSEFFADEFEEEGVAFEGFFVFDGFRCLLIKTGFI
jgi:hypothetical protein